MRCAPRHVGAARCARAFTLMELLVVVAMISLFVAIGFPTINAMTSGTSEASAENAVQMSVKAARAYARQPQAFTTRSYEGAAALFTPSNEIRMVRSIERRDAKKDELVKNGGGGVLSLAFSPYEDIPDREYIDLPPDVIVVGISRVDPDGLVLLAPPFAVRFDPRGQLVVRLNLSSDQKDNVLYDANGDGWFTQGSTRRTITGGYDPDDWNAILKPSLAKRGDGTYQLPFELIEPVAGVIIVSEPAFRGARDSSNNPLTLEADTALQADGINTAARDWILANGKTILINRHSGVVSDR